MLHYHTIIYYTTNIIHIILHIIITGALKIGKLVVQRSQ